jgi:hypothetical protein
MYPMPCQITWQLFAQQLRAFFGMMMSRFPHSGDLLHSFTRVTRPRDTETNRVNPEAWLAWVLERIQDHPAHGIGELMPWAYQAMVDARKAEAKAKKRCLISCSVDAYAQGMNAMAFHLGNVVR